MKTKRRLFKKFHEIDFNAYYSAEINGEMYFAVSSLFYYTKPGFLGVGRVQCAEEQSFKSIKVSHILGLFLNGFLDAQAELEENDSVALGSLRESVYDKLIESTTLQEFEALDANPKENHQAIKGMFKQEFDKLGTMFSVSWSHPLIDDYLNKGWTMIYTEYNGLATRTVWLASTYSDVITVLGIKLFGKQADNEVVEYNRLLANAEILNAFFESIENNQQHTKGATK